MRLRAAHYATGAPLELTVAGARLAAVGPPSAAAPDLAAAYVAPGFCDPQINGGGGHGFSSSVLTADQVWAVVERGRRHGVTQFCPTLITNSFQALRHGFQVLRQAVERDAALARALPLFHLEGPYVAAEDGPRGAHPRAHVRPPNWDEFQRWQEAAGGRIGMVTLAPEVEGAIPFIARLARAGVVVALGHTAATPARIREAIAAGARMSTHLGNGCALTLHRHDNPIWAQLAADELWASLICDGHHLPPAVVRCLVRGKTPARLVLTCDASPLAGLPPGLYGEWEQELEVHPSGKIVVRGQGVLAGSATFTDVGVGNVMRFAGLTLAEAVDLATAQPRRLLGLPVPTLEAGQPADLVLFDLDAEGRVAVRYTLVGGVPVAAEAAPGGGE